MIRSPRRRDSHEAIAEPDWWWPRRSRAFAVSAFLLAVPGAPPTAAAQTPSGITLTVDKDSVAENGGAERITVTATVDGQTAVTANTIVQVSVGGGTATVGDDYTAVPDFDITIRAGAREGLWLFDLTPNDDPYSEVDETVEVTGVSGSLSITKATITITSDDPVPTYTFTADEDTISEPVPGASAETTINLTVTRSAPVPESFGIGAPLQWEGTAQPRSGSENNDYLLGGDNQISIKKGETTGKATVRIQPIDDGFWEGPETISVSAVFGLAAHHVVPAVINLLDKDEKPEIKLIVSIPGGFEEGKSSTMTIRTVLEGSLVQEPIAVKIIGNLPKTQEGFSYDPPGPWDLEIPAERRTATRGVTVRDAQDDKEEVAEYVFVRGTASALGDTIPVGEDRFRLSSNDQLHFRWGIRGVRGRASGQKHVFKFWAIAEGADIPKGGAKLTLKPETRVGWFSPGSLTFSWDEDLGCGGSEAACTKELDWTVTAPELEQTQTIGFSSSATASGADRSSDVYRSGLGLQDISFFQVKNPPKIVQALKYIRTIPVGGRKFDSRYSLSFEVSFDRLFKISGSAVLRLYLDSGPVDVRCGFLGVTPEVLRCQYFIARSHYDFDKEIHVRAGGLSLGTGITDPNDPDTTWTAPEVVPTATSFTLPVEIYGTGHAFEAKASVQEGFREGAGEQVLAVVFSDVGQRGADQDITIPIQVTNKTTTAADWRAVTAGEVTIKKGQSEGSGEMKIEALLDGINEDAEELNVGALGDYPVRPDTLTLFDAPELILTLDTTEGNEGTEYSVKFTLSIEEGASPLGNDLADIVILSRGEPVGGLEGSVADFNVLYGEGDDGLMTLEAGERFVEKTRTVQLWDDNLVEGDEVILFTPYVPFYTIRPAEFTIKDANTDSDVMLAVNPAVVSEGGGSQDVTVTASLSGDALADDVHVVVDVSGSAKAGATSVGDRDYTPTWSPASRQIVIPAGQAAGSAGVTLTVVPLDDAVREAEETISVQGTATQQDAGETPLVVQIADVAFTDNDTRGVTVAPTALSVQRGASTSYRVRLNSQPELRPNEKVRVAPQLAGTAVVTVMPDALEFDATDWATDKVITVTAPPAARNEIDTITHDVRGGDYLTVTADPVVVTVTEAPTMTLELDQTSIDESGGVATVTATLDGASPVEVKVKVSVDPTAPAVAGDVVLSANADLTFAAGSTTSTGTVTITAQDNGFYIAPPNAEDPPAPREFTVSGEVSGHLGIPDPDDLTLEVPDDDAIPSFSIADAEGGEDENLAFTVTRAGAPDNVVSVKWTTAEDDAEGAEGASLADYTAVTTAATLDFAKGDTEKSLTVTITDDDLDEPAEETFLVVLSEPGEGSEIADGEDEATGTIEDDDDPPSFSIADAAADEGEKVAFTVTRAGASGNVASVKVATQADGAEDADAADADDYTALTTAKTLDFATGVTSVTVEVDTTEDDLFEPDETFEAVLSEPELGDDDPGTGVSIEADGGIATGTIQDDDTEPAFSISDASASEGDAIRFTVTRAGAEDNVVSVHWNTKEDGSEGADAASASDYTTVTTATKLDFAKGVTEQTFTVATTEDVIHEPAETFVVELTDAGGGARIETAEATGTITNDDDLPSGIGLTVNPASVTEDGGEKTVTVTATVDGSTRYADAKTVTVSVGGGTAASPADYAAVTDFNITIAAGAASGTGSFDLTPVDDALDEPDETVDVTGTSGSLAIRAGEVTITDNDVTPSFLVADASGAEGDAISFTVTRAGATANAVSVKWATAVLSSAGAASATDFTGVTTAQTLSFAAGETTQTVTVPTTEDVLDEEDETFEVRLSEAAKASGDPGGTPTITDTAAVGTITDDDDAPSGIELTVNPASVTEDGGEETVTVTATVGGATRYADAKTVTVSVGGGTAATTDYAAVASFEITIAAGAASGTADFDLTPVDDDVDEPNETVLVTGASGTLTVTGDEVTITDDEETPTATLVLTPSAISENGADNVSTVTATLSGGSSAPVTLTVATAPGTGTGTAATDYTQSGTTLTFAAGATTSTGAVTITAEDNDVDAPNKTVTVSGTAAGGEVANPADQTLTITDDETTPTVALLLTPSTIAESGAGNASTITATLSGKSSVQVTVAVSVPNGAPVTLTQNRTLTFAAEAITSTGAVTITAEDNDVDAPNATVEVSGDTSGGEVGDPADQTLTITDDETTPTVTLILTPSTIAESGAGNASTVTATLSGKSSSPVTVTVSVPNGAPVTLTQNRTLTFAAEATTSTGAVTITAVNNDVDAPNATVEVSGDTSGGEVEDPDDQTLTITDDETTPTVELVLTPSTIAESGAGNASTITATLSGKSSVQVTVAVSVPNGAPVTLTQNRTLTFAAEAITSTGAVTITAEDNDVDAPNATVEVSGDTSGGEVGDPDDETLTITDDEATPTVALVLTPSTIAESGAGNASTVTATLSGKSSAQVTVTVSVPNGAPVTLAGSTLTIAAEATTSTGTVTITAVNNDVDAPNKTVTVSGTAGGNGVTDPADVELTIEDDDDAPTGITLRAAPDSVTEDGGEETITVTATVNGSTRYAEEKTVTVSVGGGTAVSPADYAAVTNFNITIAAGAASGTADFDLTPVDDALDEENETVDVTGTSGSLTITAGKVTITDNDVTPSFSVANASGAEGDAISFTVTRAGATANAVSVKWATAVLSSAGAASATDFTGVTTAQTLSFAAGDTTKTVTVQTTEDVLDEEDETFEVRLSEAAKAAGDPGGTPTITDTAAVGTITDDDDPPSGIILTANPASVTEDGGEETVTVTARVDGATRYAEEKTVTVSVADGTATSPADYAAVTNFNITIAAGAASGTADFDLTPVDDALDEPDETVDVTGTSGSLTITAGKVTITDDDVTPSFSVADASGAEGDAISFTVTRAGATANAVSVKWATAVLSSAGAASATDFTGVTTARTLSFAAGETTQTITVQTTDDMLDEEDETFEVRLSEAAKGSGDPGGTPTITDTAAVGTITDDDAAPTGIELTANPDSVTEDGGEETVTVTATVTGGTRYADAKTVAVSVGGGTATSPADYAAVTTFNITIAAGAESGTGSFDLTPVNDDVDEPNETVLVTGALAPLTVTGDEITITDDDDTPTVTLELSDASIAENGETSTVTAELDARSSQAVTVTVTAAPKTSTGATAADFTLTGSALSIAAGATASSGTVTITATPNNVDAPDKMVTVSGDAAGGNGVADPDDVELTIEDDDDAPTGITLSAAPDEVTEDGGEKTITVTAAVNGSTRYADAKTVAVSVGGGTATSPADYAAVTTFNITIAAGAASGTGSFDLTPVDDDLDEPNETLDVTGVSGTLTVTGDEITITDDDATPTVTLVLTPFTIAESGAGNASTVTATLSGKSSAQVTVAVSVPNGAPVTLTRNRTLTFAAEATTSTGAVTITAVDNDMDAPNATVEVSGDAAGGNGVADPDDETLTITDDEATPSFSVADASGEEGDAVTFTVTRAGATANAVSVKWATAVLSSAGAASATDFTGVTTARTLSFAAGDTTKTVTVQTTEDMLDEENETFEVRLSEAAKGTGDPGGTPTITDAAAVGTITDDDAAPSGIILTANPDSVTEDGGEETITVTARVDGATRYGDAKTVAVSVGGGTAATTDYAAVASFNITIAAGAASGTADFDLTPVDDDVDEPNETVLVTGVSGTLTVTGAEVTITDDEETPTATLVLTPSTISETGADNVSTVTAILSGGSSAPVTLTVATAPGTGTGTTDYTQSGTTLNFAAGATTSTGAVTITAVNNDLDAPNKTVTVSGTAGGGGVANPTDQTLTITDDEGTPTATLVLTPSAINENGADNVSTVTATLSGGSSAPVTLTVATAPGAGTAAADYTQSGTTLNFAAGATTSTGAVTITAVNNDVDAPNKTVTVSGSAGGGGIANPADQTLTITDDEGTPTATLVLTPSAINESGATNVSTVTATLSGGSSAPVTLTVATAPGTGTAAADYTQSGTTLTFPAGATTSTGTVTITAVNNDVDAPNKTVTVSGSAGGGGVANPADQTLTITDDEGTPTATLVLTPSTINEDGAGNVSTVTATLSGESSAPVTVTVSVPNGAPVTLTGSTLAFAAGATTSTGTVTITAVNNDVDAPNATVAVSGAASGGGVANPADQTLTITDDEGTPTATLVLTPSTINEDGAGNVSTVTATLSGESSAPVTVTVSVPNGAPVTLTGSALTFAAGATTSTGAVTITAVNNDLDAPNKTVTVSGSAGGGGIANPADQTLTITDDDAAPTGITLTANPDSVTEDGGEETVTVTAAVDGSTRYADAKTVAVSVGGGTATATADYAAVTTFNITIAAGAASGTGDFDLTPVDDDVDEPNETVLVTGASGTLTVTGDEITITDDDAAPSGITLTANPDSVTEDGGEETVTVTAAVNGSTRYADAKTVAVSVGGGTATATTDYAAVTTFNITIAAGAASGTGDFDLTPVDDDVDEPNETVLVIGASGTLTVTGDEVTITDDEGTPTATLVLTPSTISETGSTNVSTVTATLSGGSSAPVTLTVATAPGAETAATDYTQSGTTLTFAAGATTSTGAVTITAVNNDVDAPNKTVTVSGTAGGGVTNPADQTLTITDDEGTPTATLVLTPSRISESGGTNASTVTATLSGESSAPVTVTVSVPNGAPVTLTGSALTFAAGATTSTGAVTITAVNNDVDAPNKTVTVSGTAGGGVTNPADETLTITDDEGTPTATLVLTPPTISENGADNVSTVTATLSVGSSAPVTLTVATAPGTGTVVADYTQSGTTLNFAAGATTSTGAVTITAVNNDVDAPNKTVTVSGTAGGGVTNPADEMLTITDDEGTPTATLVLTPSTISENGADNVSTVTATLSVGSSAPVTLTVATAPGSGTAAADYTQSGTTLTFPAGATTSTGTVTITAVNNDVDAPNKTVTVSGSAGGGVTNPSDQTLTITDDEGTPTATLVLTPSTISENGADNVSTVTATLSVGSSAPVTLTVATVPGSGTAAADYTQSGTTLTFPAGATTSTGTVTITAVNNDVDAPNKTVTVSGSAGGGVTNPSDQTLTITDDEGTPTATLVLTPSTISETGSTNVSTVTATLSVGSSAPVTLTVATAPGSGTAATDYTQTGTTLTFAAGATTSTGAVTITAVNNDVDAPNKTVTVSGSAGGGVTNPSDQTLTITDDEGSPTATLVLTPSTISETGSTNVSTVTATLSVGSSAPVTLTVATAPGAGTAAADYTQSGTTLNFAAGATTSTGAVTITAVNNDVDAPNKTVTVSGTAGGGVTNPADETLTITDDEGTPTATLVLTPSTISENGADNVSTVTATLSVGSSAPVTLTVATAPGTGTAATDYTQTGTTLNFAAGATTSTGAVTITAVNNDVDAPNKTVTVSGSAGGGVTNPSDQTLTITDDEGTPTATLVLTPSTISENGADNVSTVTATLSVGSSAPVTLTVATAPGSGTAAADYTQSGTTLTFPAGATTSTGTVTITAVNNDVDAPNKTVTVSGSAGGGVTNPSDQTLTITDDEGTPTATLVLTPSTISETGSTNVSTVTATLSVGSSAPVTLTVATAPGSGTAAADYTQTGTTLTFAAGATTSTGAVTITAVNNDVDAPNKTVTVSGSVGGGVTNPSDQTLTITDDEGSPTATLVLTPSTISETGSTNVSTVTATLSVGSSAPVTLTVATAPGAGTAAADYTQSGTTLTFAAGATTSTGAVTITAVNNDVDAPNKTVTVSGSAGGGVANPADATLTITDDDDAPSATLVLTPPTIAENGAGNAATVTATLSAATFEDVILTVSVPDDAPVTLAGSTLTITAGAITSGGTVTLTAVNNDVDAPDATVAVSAAAAGGGVQNPADVTLTITDDDDDAPSATLVLTPPTIAENGAGNAATVTATLSAATFEDVILTVSVPNDAPVTLAGSTLTITAGAITSGGTVTLTAVNNDVDAPDATVAVSAAAAGGGVQNPADVTLTITDDDVLPGGITLTAAPQRVGEAAGATTVTVTATVDGGGTFPDAQTVTVSVGGGTATAGTDYAAVANFDITIGAGAASGTGSFTLTPTDDALDKADETVQVSGTSGALTITGDEITIADDDAPPGGITLTAAPDSVGEADGATTVTVTARVNGTTRYVGARTVTVSVGGGDATTGTDYATVASFDITIGAGAGSGTGSFTLTPTDDALDELDETVEVTGTSGAATVTPDTITIRDDDDVVDPADRIYEFSLPEEQSGPRTVGDVAEPEDPLPIAYLLQSGGAERFDVTQLEGDVRYVGQGEDYETGPRTFDLEVEVENGPAGLIALAHVRVNVINVPEPPEARDDAVETPEDTPVVIDVLANDSDPDGDELRIVRSGRASNGRTAIVRGGGIRYTPDENWYGVDAFEYEVQDPGGLSDTARVVVTVTPVNDPPEAVDDAAETPEDTPVIIDVLAEDTDVDGDTVRLARVGAPSHGTATLASEGRVRYVPDRDWHGTDRFEYTIVDPEGLEDSATVTVVVTPVNDPPEAVDDEAETPEDTPVVIDVLANDTDVDGDTVRLSRVGAASHGTATLAPGGHVLYDPDRDWFGTDRFEYAIVDPEGLEDSATVTVVVHPVNDAPVAVGVIPDQRIEEGGDPGTVEITPFFADVDDAVLTYEAVSSNPDAVRVTVSGGMLTLTPVVTGSAAITVTARDAEGLAATQQFTVSVGDELVRAVLTDVFAGFGRAHLSSLRTTLGRRLATGSDANRFNLAGQYFSRGRFGEIGLGGLQQTQEMAFGAASWEANRRSAALGGSLTDPERRLENAGPTTSPGSGLGSFGSSGESRWLQSTDVLFSFGGQDDDGNADGEQPRSRRWTVWGQGDIQTFRAERTAKSAYEGDLRTGYLGLDLALGERWLVGVAASRSVGDARWRVGASGGGLDTGVTTVHPYARWADGNTSVWALGGFGRGDASGKRDLTGLEDGSALRLGLGLVEARQRLAATPFGLSVDVKTEASWARLATGAGEETLDGIEAEVRRLRTGVELGMQLSGPGGIAVAPFTAVSTLHDGGAGPEGFGLEVAGGVRLQGRGLRLEAQGRRLILHAADEYREQGFSLNAGFGGGLSQPGWNATLRQRWGASGNGAETLWQDHFSPQDQQFGSASDGLDGRLGYGLPIGSAKLLSAFGGYGRLGAGRRIELGMNLGGLGIFGFGPDNPMMVEFAGERHDAGGFAPDYRMRLLGIIRFGGGQSATCRTDECRAAAAGIGSWRRTRTELTPGGGAETHEPSGAGAESPSQER